MLNPYSAQALAALQQLLPDLAPLVVEKEDYFTVETVSPSGWPFWLFSDDEQLTVGFAEYHTHFGWAEGEPAKDVTDAAEFIQQLRSGQLELAVWYEGEEYVGSVPREVGTSSEPTWLQRWWRRKQRQEIRRWA